MLPSFVGAVLLRVQGTEVVLKGCDFGMLGPQDEALDAERFAELSQRLRWVSLGLMGGGEVVEVDGDLVVVWAEAAQPDLMGASKQDFRFGVAARSGQDGAKNSGVCGHRGRAGVGEGLPQP
jgi:hypothetical protein